MHNFRLACCLYVLLAIFTGCEEPVEIAFESDDTVFANPERGFYIPMGTSVSHFSPLSDSLLAPIVDGPYQTGSASYKVLSTLIYRGYLLDEFIQSPLSETFLSAFDHDCEVLRKNGLKMILRFAYTNSTKSGDCPDEYHICPPYGDASPATVFQHIEQLKPHLQQNSDVIAVMQEGFIGIWGENYFTDYFGDASMNGTGVIEDSSWTLRNDLLRRLLDALPQNRMIQVRTPQMRQKFLGGPSAPVGFQPMIDSMAFSGTPAARIAFHNDCFLASADDYGTFYDYGSSTQKRGEANAVLRNYMEKESRWLAVGGETCDDAFSPQNDCGPSGQALKEFAAMHYSYLNAAYNNQVNNDWDSAGCMAEIQRRLGYRFYLQKASLPASVVAGKRAELRFSIVNEGFAPAFNSRKMFLLLVDNAGKIVHREMMAEDIRHWAPGTSELKASMEIPANLAPGSYRLFLELPDPAEALSANPAYSIRLANKNAWDPKTGWNALNQQLVVN